MAVAKRVTTKNSGRYYIDANGQRYWSVTTILGDGIPKKALTQWAGNESAKYVMQQLAQPLREIRTYVEQSEYLGELQDSVLPLLTDMGYENETYKSKNFYTSLASLIAHDDSNMQVTGYDQIRNASNRTRDKAGAAGSKAHDMIEEYILTVAEGSSWNWDVALGGADEPVKQIIARFQDFEREWEPEWEATELTVFNASAGYAGSLDFIAHIPLLGEGLTLGDFKTGRGVFPETALQMAAYRHAEFVETAGHKASVPMPETERSIVVHLRPDDDKSYQDKHPKSYYEIIPMNTDDEVFEMFKYVSQVAWFTREGNSWQHDPITIEQAQAGEK
tara:strand:- start:2461 stop:3459 length:999 start_codon:yes stop_codon:yes gene_type:complete